MCEQCNTNKCNCNNKPEFCGCKTKLDLLCSVYTGDNLELLDINKWDSANTAFEKINTFLNSLQEQDPLLIENIGGGNGVFKDLSDEYKYQFKSIVKGDGILITNQEDTLTISIDQDYLIGLIQQNIPGS